MIFADHLRRNVNPEVYKVPTVPGLNLEVSSLEFNASLSKLECTRVESNRDPQMLMLKKLVIQGWPKDIKQCTLPIRPYWNFRDELFNFRDELFIIDGIVVKGTPIVIPTKF